MSWRPVVGFSDYEVSEHGDVRRATDAATRKSGWRLRGFVDHDGYLRYQLRSADGVAASFPAHRLVIEAFVGLRPSTSHEVAHNNGSRVDNHWTNLRWALRKDNHADIQVHGTSVKGEKNGRSKIKAEDVAFIRSEYRAIKERMSTRSLSDLEGMFGLHRSTIIDIAKGRAWSHVSTGVA